MINSFHMVPKHTRKTFRLKAHQIESTCTIMQVPEFFFFFYSYSQIAPVKTFDHKLPSQRGSPGLTGAGDSGPKQSLQRATWPSR